jgi:hypothetical protein
MKAVEGANNALQPPPDKAGGGAMSARGQSRHFHHGPVTSGLPQEADIFGVRRHVSKVPTTDVQYRSQPSKAGEANWF